MAAENNQPQQKRLSNNPVVEEVDDIDEINEEEGAPAWMVTFADLMTLLLVFFVLLFSMSEVEVSKFKVVMEAMKGALTNTEIPATIVVDSQPEEIIEPEPVPEPDPEEEPEPEEKPFESAEEILEDINQIIERKKLGEFIIVEELKDRIIIRLEGKAVFSVGDVDMLKDVEPVMDDILGLLQKHSKYNINIKGHTDNIPINTVRFPSNWELSAVRATTVLRYFVDHGISPSRMTATGYADRIPIASNDTEQGRTMNRRVEFVLEKFRK